MVNLPTGSPASDAANDLSEDDFDDDTLPDRLSRLSTSTLDDADFGIIRLDDNGYIEFYNQFEADLSGVDRDEVIGISFFEDLAPCTHNDEFAGRFFDGVQQGRFDTRFRYTFTYRFAQRADRAKPTLVDVRMCRNQAGDNWILVNPMAEASR
jgi:photoactive yellow protein